MILGSLWEWKMWDNIIDSRTLHFSSHHNIVSKKSIFQKICSSYRRQCMLPVGQIIMEGGQDTVKCTLPNRIGHLWKRNIYSKTRNPFLVLEYYYFCPRILMFIFLFFVYFSLDYFWFENFKKRNDRKWRSLLFNEETNVNSAFLLITHCVPFDAGQGQLGLYTIMEVWKFQV